MGAITPDDQPGGPPADGDNQVELQAIARRLERERPIPRPAFRSELRRRLLFTPGQSPRRVRALIAAYATSGLALLLVAAIGIAGGGPLAA